MSVLGITYDAGALIAAERGDLRFGAIHADALRRGVPPTVPAGVLAQVWRGGPQPNLSRVLSGCRVEALTEERARAIGRLAAVSGHDDAVDLSVVEGAARRTDIIVTSDPGDLERIAASLGAAVRLVVV
ncbi:twitching motility protein PilT [Nocardioides humilatus]|uniref:Twitching motility protein PilT n=1 Tax=Nocardioides humilatus TaxID=2607660 RepID=A0A5B1LEP0_9ACTN|nr:twitching motility protein PilT [Nocardioides humilatus]KAA1419173.1 twitching motility protein PilT [Nocardioides humilatus]